MPESGVKARGGDLVTANPTCQNANMAGDENEKTERPRDRNEAASQEALRDLERLTSQGEVIGTSAMVRAAKKAGEHLKGNDAKQDDPIEVWGTRIGRGLGAVFFVFLVFYLLFTYVL